METLPIHTFKESFGPFIALLNEYKLEYRMREVSAGVPMASGGTIEILQVVGNAAMWASIATVVVAFINRRRGRKVIITTKDNTVVHVEGLSQKELEAALAHARALTVIDPNKAQEAEGTG